MRKTTGEQTNIVLANLADPTDGAWLDWFNAAFADGMDWRQGKVVSIADLGAMPSTGKLILIYVPLEMALAVAAQAGLPPSAAIADWERGATALLAFHRSNRRRIFLVASDTMYGAAAETLRDRIADWANLVPSPVRPADVPTVAVPPVLRLITAQALHASPRLKRMVEELAAGGFALRQGDVSDNTFLDEVFSEFQRGLNAGPAAMRADQQNQHLFQQLLALQATLEHEAKAGAALQFALKEELDARATEQAVTLQERLQAVAAHEQDVAALRESEKKLAEEKRILAESLLRAEGDLQQVYLSSSWKVTAPLRATRRRLPWSRE